MLSTASSSHRQLVRQISEPFAFSDITYYFEWCTLSAQGHCREFPYDVHELIAVFPHDLSRELLRIGAELRLASSSLALSSFLSIYLPSIPPLPFLFSLRNLCTLASSLNDDAGPFSLILLLDADAAAPYMRRS